MFKSKREFVFIILTGIFITNAIVAELIGGKLIQIGPFIMSIGIIPWPIVFLTTDIINEFYGKSGVRKLTIITASLIAYAFVILFFTLIVPAAKGVPTVSDEQFTAVFGQSMWIIVGSIVAFLLSQYIDVTIFWMLRNKTGGKMIWLRSTGSTIISQLVDSFVVLGIAFWLSGKVDSKTYVNMSFTNYACKLIIAVGLTPLIYLGHNLIDKYFGDEEAHKIIKESAEESLQHSVEE